MRIDVIFSRLSIERKRSEKALEQSNQTLCRVMQNMPVMMNAFDLNGLIIVWNRECEQVTGYGADEIADNPKAMEILYPDPHYRQHIIDGDGHRFGQLYYKTLKFKLLT